MTTIIYYLASWFTSPESKISEEKQIGTLTDGKEKFDIIPNPARNMPCISIKDMAHLNRADLKAILEAKNKLRSIPPREVKEYHLPDHPVLVELLNKTKHRRNR